MLAWGSMCPWSFASEVVSCRYGHRTRWPAVLVGVVMLVACRSARDMPQATPPESSLDSDRDECYRGPLTMWAPNEEPRQAATIVVHRQIRPSGGYILRTVHSILPDGTLMRVTTRRRVWGKGATIELVGDLPDGSKPTGPPATLELLGRAWRWHEIRGTAEQVDREGHARQYSGSELYKGDVAESHETVRNAGGDIAWNTKIVAEAVPLAECTALLKKSNEATSGRP